MNITRKDALKVIRAEAKANGLTFKEQNATINSVQAWKFVSRSTGETIISNCTLWSAYAIVTETGLSQHAQ